MSRHADSVCDAAPASLPGLPSLASLSPKVRRKCLRKWHQIGCALARREGSHPGPAAPRLSSSPTPCLLLANAGLHNGIGLSELLELTDADGAGRWDGLARIVQPAGQPYCLMLFSGGADAAEAAAARLQLRRIRASSAGEGTEQKPGMPGEVTIYVFFVDWSLSEVAAADAVDAPEPSATVALAAPRPDQLPPGLHLLPDAVSPAEAADLLALVDAELAAVEGSPGSLRCRRVLHWGHEFLYGSNRLSPLPARPLPAMCAALAGRLVPSGLPRPDQLTVNVYEPGGGIPAHVDSHAAFGDYVLSVSLASGCVFRMTYKAVSPGQPGPAGVSFVLPVRSALLMTGEARLLWAHEMPARRVDPVTAASGGGCDLVWRDRRVSFTFRRARPPGEACRCGNAGVCDDEGGTAGGLGASEGANPSKSTARNEITQDRTPLDAERLESEFVHSVYDSIAEHFSDTRHSRWPRVAEFLAALPPGSLLLDVGCGNGKNMLGRGDLLTLGCDRSARMCGVCAGRGLPVFRADALRLPVRAAAFDAAVCVAVLHHLSTPSRRAAALRELARVCRPGAPLLVYVWALEQRLGGRASAYLRKPAAGEAATGAALDARTGLGVHRPGSEFSAADLLVPWRGRGGGGGNDKEQLRYYHLFSQGELDRLCAETGLFRLVESYYDNGNWCVMLARNQAPT